MKAIRLSLLAIIYSLSTFSICILSLAVFALALYLGSSDDYPGSFLLWVANERVLATLIIFAVFMMHKSVREDGAKVIKKLLSPAFAWFEKI